MKLNVRQNQQANGVTTLEFDERYINTALKRVDYPRNQWRDTTFMLTDGMKATNSKPENPIKVSNANMYRALQNLTGYLDSTVVDVSQALNQKDSAFDSILPFPVLGYVFMYRLEDLTKIVPPFSFTTRRLLFNRRVEGPAQLTFHTNAALLQTASGGVMSYFPNAPLVRALHKMDPVTTTSGAFLRDVAHSEDIAYGLQSDVLFRPGAAPFSPFKVVTVFTTGTMDRRVVLESCYGDALVFTATGVTETAAATAFAAAVNGDPAFSQLFTAVAAVDTVTITAVDIIQTCVVDGSSGQYVGVQTTAYSWDRFQSAPYTPEAIGTPGNLVGPRYFRNDITGVYINTQLITSGTIAANLLIDEWTKATLEFRADDNGTT